MICRTGEAPVKESISLFYCFDCEVCLEIQSGMAALIVSEMPETDTFESFAVHRYIKLKPNIYFQLAAVSAHVTYRLITEKEFILTDFSDELFTAEVLGEGGEDIEINDEKITNVSFSNYKLN